MIGPTRRELLKFGSGGAILAYAPASVFARSPDSVLELSDFRFRLVMRKALRRLRQQRKIRYWQFRETRAALFNSFTYVYEGQQGSFLDHLRHDVEQDAQTCGVVLATAAGIFIESLILWIIENWNNILVFVVQNLKLLEVALDDSEE